MLSEAEKRARFAMHLSDQARLVDKQMTPAEYARRHYRDRNMDRLKAMLAEQVDVERNLTGVKECRRALTSRGR